MDASRLGSNLSGRSASRFASHSLEIRRSQEKRRSSAERRTELSSSQSLSPRARRLPPRWLSQASRFESEPLAGPSGLGDFGSEEPRLASPLERPEASAEASAAEVFDADPAGRDEYRTVLRAAESKREIWVPPWTKARHDPPGGAKLEVGAVVLPPLTARGERGERGERQSSTPRSEKGSSSLSPQRHCSELMGDILNRILPLDSVEPWTPGAGGSAETAAKIDLANPPSPSARPHRRHSYHESGPDEGAAELAPAGREDADQVEANLVVFRGKLHGIFGNLYRAFKAMKHAVSKSTNSDQSTPHLTCREWEWVVCAHLRLCDRTLARKLFEALDKDGSGSVSLKELAGGGVLGRGTGGSETIPSIIEFRKRILEQYQSLQAAFHDMEEMLEDLTDPTPPPAHAPGKQGAPPRRASHCEGVGKIPMTGDLFFGACQVLGLAPCLEPAHCAHIFRVLDLDGNGTLTMEEFIAALEKLPPPVLLQDLRQRLLARFPTISAALRETTSAAVCSNRESTQVWVSKALGPREFCEALSKLGVSQMEASEMFKIIDEDGSGDVCLNELQDSLRSVAPATSLQGFWQRFVAEWPELAARDGSAERRRQLLTAIVTPLVQALRQKGAGKTPQAHLLATKRLGRRTSDVFGAVGGFSPEAFDCLCRALDISRRDSLDIFWRLGRAAAEARAGGPRGARGRRRGADEGEGKDDAAEQEAEISFEDFLQQLQRFVTGSFSAGLMEIVGPTRMVIQSLKQELSQSLHPDRPSAGAQDDEDDEDASRSPRSPRAPRSSRRSSRTGNLDLRIRWQSGA